MGMDNNAPLYRPPEPVLCVVCRRPNPNPACSACPSCVPPDEGEIRLQGRVAALEAEVRMYQDSCEEHVRIRNEQAERLATYRDLLRIACVELVVIDPRRNRTRDAIVDRIEAAVGESWGEMQDALSTCPPHAPIN